ncbi:MAG: cysC cysN, partial [Ilumatobacteraceae bacterium]|nr:cysC cysN [Ilumatobacteraceae bacterium]
MSNVHEDLMVTDIEAYLDAHEHKSLLRFITCGSVDDGKSTLIGRLLYETHLVFEDHMAALEADSKKFGTQGAELDFALLLDGLASEREQGITIDVAYRYFSTEKRKFIIADTPGHEQYTRNMVTGASNADAAVILVDARKGVLTQTRRHSHVVSLLGIRHVVFAVNKMDLVGFDEPAYRAIEASCRALARPLEIADPVCIPVSALRGDNVLVAGDQMPWYDGPTLMRHLADVEVDEERMQAAPFRFPVQWVNRPDLDFRGFAGTVVGGAVRPGDRVVVLPSRRASTVARVVSYEGDLELAVAGQAVTLVLADELDVSRGDVIAHADSPPAVNDALQATVVWMADAPLLPGRDYLLRIGTRTVQATATPLKHKLDVETFDHVPARKLELNEIGVLNFELAQAVPWDAYTDNRDTGGFILIDRLTNGTVGAGLVRFALRRSDNVHWQVLDVDRRARAAALSQQPCLVWFTGLSGAGKSAIANLVERRLHADGQHTYLLDGDNLRHGLNKDLGFTAADRVENIRRVAEVGRLMVDAGLIVLASFISPFRAERRMARELLGEDAFLEVFVDTPQPICEARDVKQLYAKARRGEIKNFTG